MQRAPPGVRGWEAGGGSEGPRLAYSYAAEFAPRFISTAFMGLYESSGAFLYSVLGVVFSSRQLDPSEQDDVVSVIIDTGTGSWRTGHDGCDWLGKPQSKPPI